MSENSGNTLPKDVPFDVEESTVVGESRKTVVVKPKDSNTVIKAARVDTGGEIVSAKEALIISGLRKQRRTELLERLKEVGAKKTVVPEVQPVVFGGENEGVGLAHVQSAIKKDKFLLQMGTEVLAMPDQTLEELRSIFKLQLELASEGKRLDIIGTSPKGTGPVR